MTTVPPSSSLTSMTSLRRFLEWFDARAVVLAVVAGLLVRVMLISVVFGWDAEPYTSDDATYVRFARAVVETGHLTTHHFPVGYVLFVAAFLKLGSAAFPAIRVTHVVLGLLTVVAVSAISKLLYGRRSGQIAAWMSALYPPLVFMNGRIMSETLFIALLMFSLLFFLKSDRERGPLLSALAAGLLALGSLARSNLVPMMPFVPVWYLLASGQPLRDRLKKASVAITVAAIILLLPGLYFLASKGEFLPFATNAGQTFYGANNPLATGGWIEMEDHQELLSSIPSEVRRSPAAYSKAQQQLGVAWIRQYPADFLALLPKKLANAWVPGFQRSETTQKSRLAALVLALSAGAVLFGAFAGRLLVRPAQRDGILLAVLGTYTIMSLAFYGNPRIGLFCAPVLIVYAAAAVSWALSRMAARRVHAL